MWNITISLPTGNTRTQNVNGFVTDRKTYQTGIPASRKDATRQDIMLAYQTGYNADIVVEIDAANYNGASSFIDESDGTEYLIKRTFKGDRKRFIQLTGEKRQKGKVI